LQDILCKAGVHPKRKAADLSPDERSALHRAVKAVMNEALNLRGRHTERDLFDNPGGYYPVMGGHMKDRPCPGCGTAIEKVQVQGSACYVCPSCQPLPP
jgi:formamidopyrimidine-DNA glycosylase